MGAPLSSARAGKLCSVVRHGPQEALRAHAVSITSSSGMTLVRQVHTKINQTSFKIMVEVMITL